MARATGKTAVKYAVTDVCCSFELTVHKSRGRSRTSSRARMKQSSAGRKGR